MLFYVKQHHEFSPMAAVESDPHHHASSPIHKKSANIPVSMEHDSSSSMDLDTNGHLLEGEGGEEVEEDELVHDEEEEEEEVYELDDEDEEDEILSNY